MTTKNTLIAIIAILNYASGKSLLDYFPQAEGKGYKITWAHAANFKDKLLQALDSDVMMLEADVSPHPDLGPSVPIMAHPPVLYWDLTLSDWLKIVSNSSTSKGIKLDFKNLEVVSPSIKILEEAIPDTCIENVPLLLNADILKGPTNPLAKLLNATEFLDNCKSLFNSSMLSVGWTTLVRNETAVYDDSMVEDMLGVLNETVSMGPQEITFPVRACFTVNSVTQMSKLLGLSPNVTLTVWSSQGDPVTATELASFHENFCVAKVYYDLPSPLREEFIDIVDRNLTRQDL